MPDIKLPATCDPPGSSNPPSEAVWVIFGATSNLGRKLVETVLSHNDKVVAIGWSQQDKLADVYRGNHENVTCTLCEIRVEDSVKDALQLAKSKHQRIDIIANLIHPPSNLLPPTPTEHLPDSALRLSMDTYLFGTLNLLSLSIPLLRAQQPSGGRYLLLSSPPESALPGAAALVSGKAAMEGLVESMLYEVVGWGIHATLVTSAGMRLEETGADVSNEGKGSSVPSEDILMGGYSDEHSPANHAARIQKWMEGRQPVSMEKSAELMWQLGHCKYPPLRLLLGSYAVESVRDRLRCVIEEIEDWKHLNFPAEDEEMAD